MGAKLGRGPNVSESPRPRCSSAGEAPDRRGDAWQRWLLSGGISIQRCDATGAWPVQEGGCWGAVPAESAKPSWKDWAVAAASLARGSLVRRTREAQLPAANLPKTKREVVILDARPWVKGHGKYLTQESTHDRSLNSLLER